MFNGGSGASGMSPQLRRTLAGLGSGLGTIQGNTAGGNFARAFGGTLSGGNKFDNREFDEGHKNLDAGIRMRGQDLTDDLGHRNADTREREADSRDEDRRERRDQVERGVRGRGREGDSVYERKKKDWLALYPNDQAGALQYAGGKKQMSPADRRLAAERLATQQAGNILLDKNLLRQRTEEILDGMRRDDEEERNARGNPRSPASPSAPAAPPANDPARMTPGDGNKPLDIQAPPMPPALPPGSQYSPSREQWRTPDGRIYDNDGNRVE